ncbi:MAG TPA: RDD family protein [Pyrinomonadaceae bacterium]|nr:RDD family protein [Pyrinomonadaceae bacterium]
MQCVVCGGSYSDSLENCPHCPTTTNTAPDEAFSSPEEKSMPTSTSQERKTQHASSAAGDAKGATTASATSTLIEFPGVPPKPQWRKELSERVREIQQRRALEAARELEASAPAAPQHNYVPNDATLDATGANAATNATADTAAPPLGLVPPPPEAPQPNPLVVAALKRIERARQSNPTPPMSRSSRGGGAAAAAVARFVEEDYQAAPETALAHGQAVAPAPQALAEGTAEVVTSEKPSEAARPAPPPLAIVPPAPPVKTAEETAAARARTRRHIPVVADDGALTQIEAQMHAAVLGKNHSAPVATTTVVENAPLDDHAPVAKRIAGGIVDLLVVAFASTPFAAIIELTNGNWADVRVAASMGGIVVVLMFLYLMAATALAGRTWGMSLVSLRTVDAVTGMSPTTGQCVRRALGYMLSLATLGLGLLYALFDAEGRAAHDHLSGTIVIAD